jgi:hypothetical protein
VKGYTEIECLPAWAIRAFHRATELVNSIQSHLQVNGEWIRCHELARAVEPYLDTPWMIVDGYHGSVQHSWLERRHGSHETDSVILDVYAVAQLPMVQLVSGHWSAIDVYKAGKMRTDIREYALKELDTDLQVCFDKRGERSKFKPLETRSRSLQARSTPAKRARQMSPK